MEETIDKLIERCKNCNLNECINCEISWNEVQAIKRLINRLRELEQIEKEHQKAIEKKDKIIDEMALWLYEDDTSFGYGRLKDVNTKEKIKEYFKKKAEEN